MPALLTARARRSMCSRPFLMLCLIVAVAAASGRLSAQTAPQPIRVLLADGTVVRGVVQAETLPFTSKLGVSAVRPEEIARYAAGTLALRDGTTLLGSFSGGTLRLQTPQGLLSVRPADIRELGEPASGADAPQPLVSRGSRSVPPDSVVSRWLIGAWRYENSSSVNDADGSFLVRFDNGNSVRGRWSLSGGVLSRTVVEVNCRPTVAPQVFRWRILEMTADAFTEQDSASAVFRARRVAPTSFGPINCGSDQIPASARAAPGCEAVEILGVDQTGRVAGVEVFFIRVRNNSTVTRLVQLQYRPRGAFRSTVVEAAVEQGAIKAVQVGQKRPQEIKLRACR